MEFIPWSNRLAFLSGRAVYVPKWVRYPSSGSNAIPGNAGGYLGEDPSLQVDVPKLLGLGWGGDGEECTLCCDLA